LDGSREHVFHGGVDASTGRGTFVGLQQIAKHFEACDLGLSKRVSCAKKPVGQILMICTSYGMF